MITSILIQFRNPGVKLTFPYNFSARRNGNKQKSVSFKNGITEDGKWTRSLMCSNTSQESNHIKQQVRLSMASQSSLGENALRTSGKHFVAYSI